MTNALRPLALLLPLAMAACGSETDGNRNLDTLDEELTEAATGNGADPAVKAALEDPIMVDPTLTAQANGEAIRPANRPYSAAVPHDDVATAAAVADDEVRAAPAPSKDCPQCRAAQQSVTLGALASAQNSPATRNCAARIQYAAGWASRLPAGLQLYPGARVSEAAGTDTGGCTLRAVSFSAGAPMKRVIDWYYTQMSKAGFSAEHQSDGAQHVLGGTRRDAAYVLFLSMRADGGTDVDLVANGGR
jgi:hypothetical protein